MPRSVKSPPPAPAPVADDERRCVDCGLPCTEHGGDHASYVASRLKASQAPTEPE